MRGGPQLIGAVAWDCSPESLSVLLRVQNRSRIGARGAAGIPRAVFSGDVRAATLLAVSPRYELKADFANDNRLTHSGKLSVTKRLEDQPLAFYAVDQEGIRRWREEISDQLRRHPLLSVK
jgi:hypothetical protein